MGPDEVAAWSDAVGPTFIAVIALAVVIIPLLRRRNHDADEVDEAVSAALMRRDIDDHEKRITALEARRTR